MSYSIEKNIIGALLLDQREIQKIYDKLKPVMFRDLLLQQAYIEFLKASDNGYNLDIVLLCKRLEGGDFPADIIAKTLKECVVETVTSVEIANHAQVLVNNYKAESFGKLLQNTNPKAFYVDTQIGELIHELEALLGDRKTTAKSLSEIIKDHSEAYFTDNEVPKILTGFPKLDDLLGGLEGGDVIVIGARPGIGKSALVTQIAANMARKRKRIGYYNLEMQDKQVYERFLSSQGEINLTRIRRAKSFLGDEKERFDTTNAKLAELDIVISSGSKSISEIRNESRYMGFDCIIIDYIQLVKADVRYQNRTSEVGAISKAIKALAMELNIPIIALSQLNRVSEMKETREPTMAELREAGDIEQDASVIILMWNLSNDDRSLKGIKVDKNRQGEFGKIVYKFNGGQMQFVETCETIKSATEWTRTEEGTPFD